MRWDVVTVIVCVAAMFFALLAWRYWLQFKSEIDTNNRADAQSKEQQAININTVRKRQSTPSPGCQKPEADPPLKVGQVSTALKPKDVGDDPDYQREYAMNVGWIPRDEEWLRTREKL